MAVDDPWAIDGLQLSALEWRRAMSGLLMHTTDPVSAMAGVLSGCAVTVASLTATVGAGQVVVTPQTGSNASYIFGLTATNLTIAAQDATYARIDRVVARIYDNSVDGGGQNKAAVEIITGTPSATPAPPTLPTGRLELAQLQVPKSGSGSIVVVDKRLFTVANGGTLYMPDLATLQSITPPRPGIQAVIGQGGSIAQYVHDWTGWVLTWAPSTGWVTAGLTITAQVFTPVSSYRLRRTVGRVVGRVVATCPTGAVVANVDGFVTAVNAFQLPAGWGSSDGTPVQIRCGGMWEGLVNGSQVTVVAGPPGRTMPNAAATFTFDHMVD